MSKDVKNLTYNVPVKVTASQDSVSSSSGVKPPRNKPVKLAVTARPPSVPRKGSTFTRRMSSVDRPSAPRQSSAGFHRFGQPKKHLFQNSYRLTPVAKFNSEHARAIIESVFQQTFDGRDYPPILHPEMVKRLSAEIREKVKDLKVDRYKLVCVVMIGQKVDCSITVASRCLSDVNVDTFASYTFENLEIFATGIVYAIYFE